MELIKKVNVNLPFIDVISGMPKYARFMKDLLTNRKKMESVSSVTLNAACTAVVTNQLPEKLEDLGCFTIPCLLGDLACMRALADLGASINLMPYSIYLKLAPGELRPTRMAIQLADRSIKYPRGIIENMLVKTGTLVFPTDFVVLDMEVDERIPLILGRPFFNTTRCLIDVYGQQLTLRIGDQKVSFAIDKGTGECEIASDEGDVLDEVDLMTTLMAKGYEPTEEEHEELEKANAYRSKTSIEEAPELELKPLPDNLEYAFFGEESKLPVIIASDLSITIEFFSTVSYRPRVSPTEADFLSFRLGGVFGEQVFSESDYWPTVATASAGPFSSSRSVQSMLRLPED
ncbi:uncharacterized protein [Rutidosis leptorrhynchoides]|uniref:uncharacterized protein n=1 Tax=Rutidosis leptorrhynchoides TaxID=125765 RepID=UPI003A9A2E47